MIEKRLLIIIGALSYGGAERVASVLSSAFCSYFRKVEILMYYDRPIHFEVNKLVRLNCVEKNTKTKNIFKNLFWMRKYIKENADVVLSFLAPFNMLTLTSLLGSGIPVIVADRNDPRFIPQKRSLRKIRNVLYRFASGVIVQTQDNLVCFSKDIQEKGAIIYNPVSIEETGKALVTCKQKKIVSVGRLVEQKNQVMMINAFSDLLPIYPDYKLVIYGEGSARMELKEHIRSLKLDHSVELPGAFENVLEHLVDAELFILTSNYEGMSNALIEAMCLGLPVISTKVSGATELIEDGKNGILVNIGDEGAFTQAMRKLLENKAYAKQLAQNATKIAGRLDINIISKNWVNFILRSSN